MIQYLNLHHIYSIRCNKIESYFSGTSNAPELFLMTYLLDTKIQIVENKVKHIYINKVKKKYFLQIKTSFSNTQRTQFGVVDALELWIKYLQRTQFVNVNGVFNLFSTP